MPSSMIDNLSSFKSRNMGAKLSAESKFATTLKRTEKVSIRHREDYPVRLPWPPIWDPIGKTLKRDLSSEFGQPCVCIKMPSSTKQEARLEGVARGWFIGRSTSWPKRDWPICAHDRHKFLNRDVEHEHLKN